jgi:hypothetical protein
MMFGTVFKMRPKDGKIDAINALMERQNRERGSVAGFQRAFRLHEPVGDVWVMVIFDSEDAYRKNASDPEQDKWYRQLRELLESDPEWHDGEIIEEAM